MRLIKLAAGLAALALVLPVTAAAAKEGSFHVRNDTRATLACATWPAGSARRTVFTIAPRASWSLEAKGKARFMSCTPSREPVRLKLLPGRHYAVVLDRMSGNLVLRQVGG
jgi:hypothetical protein